MKSGNIEYIASEIDAVIQRKPPELMKSKDFIKNEFSTSKILNEYSHVYDEALHST